MPSAAPDAASPPSPTATRAEEPMTITLPALSVIVPPGAQKWADAGFRVSFAITGGTMALMMTSNGLVEYIEPAAAAAAPAPAPASPAPAATVAALWQAGLREAETWGPSLDAHVPRKASASSPEASPAASHHPASLSSLSSSPRSAGEVAGDKSGDGAAPFNPEAALWAPVAAWQPRQHQQHDFSSPTGFVTVPSHFSGHHHGAFSNAAPAAPFPAPPAMGMNMYPFPPLCDGCMHAFSANAAATHAVQAAEQHHHHHHHHHYYYYYYYYYPVNENT